MFKNIIYLITLTSSFFLFLIFSTTLEASSKNNERHHLERKKILQNWENKQAWFWSNNNEKNKGNVYDFSNILALEDLLNARVLDQKNAVTLTVNALLRHAAKIKDPKTPIATLLYVGPTGVGKTELASCLAKELFGSRENIIRFDMSGFADSSALYRLIGSPPGYINSWDGGQLTNALMKKPQSIVLLDEIDKAHPQVLKLFLSAFDEGFIVDSFNRKVKCNNVIFILTTNFLSEEIQEFFSCGTGEEEVLECLEPLFMQVLSPELYNRLDPVLFKPLSTRVLDRLIHKSLQEVAQRLQESSQIGLLIDESIIHFLRKNGYNWKLGARPLKRLVENQIVAPLGKYIIRQSIQPNTTLKVYHSGKNIQVIPQNF